MNSIRLAVSIFRFLWGCGNPISTLKLIFGSWMFISENSINLKKNYSAILLYSPFNLSSKVFARTGDFPKFLR